MAIINLTQGKAAIIDDEDLARVSLFKWHFNIKKSRRANTRQGYAQRGHYIRLGLKQYTNKTIYLHRFILGVLDHPQVIVDHLNGDTLDNRKCNLRITTPQINARNRKSAINGSSSHLGVHFHKINKKWRAQIKLNNKTKCLGCFSTEAEAIAVREVFILTHQIDGYRKAG